MLTTFPIPASQFIRGIAQVWQHNTTGHGDYLLGKRKENGWWYFFPVVLSIKTPLVGLIVPTGYTFSTDGSALYMTLAALFVAQATNTHLTWLQQVTLLSVAILTSKGASGVQGALFIALVGTLSVIPTIPVAGMALILGIDRFMSMCRALVNMIGNGVATLVVVRWENELGRDTLQQNLA